MRIRTVISAVVGSLLLVSTIACSPVSAKPTLLIYGDSLTVMSEPSAQYLYRDRYTLVFRAAGGTSMCDWVAGASTDRVRFRPARVVLAFTGNAASCSIKDLTHGGVDAWVANYQHALVTMRGVFKGLPMSVVASPAMGPQPKNTWYPENGNPALNQMYKTMCAEYGMRYNTTADDTLSPGHVFTWQRKAFPGNGPMVTTRASDGVHLLPPGQLYYAAALGG